MERIYARFSFFRLIPGQLISDALFRIPALHPDHECMVHISTFGSFGGRSSTVSIPYDTAVHGSRARFDDHN